MYSAWVSCILYVRLDPNDRVEIEIHQIGSSDSSFGKIKILPPEIKTRICYFVNEVNVMLLRLYLLVRDSVSINAMHAFQWVAIILFQFVTFKFVLFCFFSAEFDHFWLFTIDISFLRVRCVFLHLGSIRYETMESHKMIVAIHMENKEINTLVLCNVV